jgi:hypothetical protein
LQIKTNIVSCHTADSKPVKQEVNGTVILPLLVFPGLSVIVSLPVEVAQWQNNQLIFLGSRVHIKEHLALGERKRGRRDALL